MTKIFLVVRRIAEAVGWIMFAYGFLLTSLFALVLTQNDSVPDGLLPSPLATHVMDMVTCRTETFASENSSETCKPMSGWLGYATSMWYLTIGFLLLPDDTHFAKDFEERKFGELKCGENKAKVRALLGEPLDVRSYSGVEAWSYTKTPNNSHYARRVVIFDGEGKLIDKDSEYYID